MTLRYILSVAASLIITVLSCLLLLWWLPVFTRSDGNLPPGLRWAQTFDATLDAGWQDGYYPWLKYDIETNLWRLGWFWRHCARVAWLYRNPCYGLDLVFGVPWDASEWRLDVYSEEPDGSVIFRATNTRTGTWNTYRRSADGTEIKTGWKAWNMFNNETGQWGGVPWDGMKRIPLCFTIKVGG